MRPGTKIFKLGSFAVPDYNRKRRWNKDAQAFSILRSCQIRGTFSPDVDFIQMLVIAFLEEEGANETPTIFSCSRAGLVARDAGIRASGRDDVCAASRRRVATRFACHANPECSTRKSRGEHLV
jgi:hypothetical protein